MDREQIMEAGYSIIASTTHICRNPYQGRQEYVIRKIAKDGKSFSVVEWKEETY